MQNRAGIDKINKLMGSVAVHDRDHILAIIKLCELNGEGVEVGTFNGTFADQILDKTGVSKLYCVDPYAAYAEFRDAINEMDMELIYAQAQRFLSRFGTRVVFVRDFSEPASTQFADESLDFVYIDGNHQSEFVTKDLKAWWPKVRPGGLLIGDDCVDLDDDLRNSAGDVTLIHRRKPDGSPDLYGDYGVFHALRAFTAERDLGYVLMGSQFVVAK